MAALTWRNVDAPDFRGTLQGQIASTAMLNNAFDNLSTGLGQIKKDQTQAVDSQALANALRVNDPTQLQQQLASADLTGVSPETLKALSSRGSDLLNQAVTNQRLDAGKYAMDRTKQTDTNGDLARPAVAALLQAGADPVKQAAVHQQYGPVLANLSNEQQLGLASDIQKLEGGALNNTGANLNNTAKALSNTVAARTDADQQAALSFAQKVQSQNIDAAGARSNLEADKTLTPGARSIATEQLNKLFPGIYGPLGSDAPTAPAGAQGAGTRAGSPYDTTYQFGATAQPLTSMKLGEVQNYQKTDLLPNKGASPVGAFQINKATLLDFAPKVLGDSWRDQTFTPEVQDKLGEAIFNARKDGNLKDTWASLPNADPGFYKNKPWSEVRQEIATNEVGQKLPSISGKEVSVSQLDTATRLMQNQSQGAAVDLPGNLANTDTPGTVVGKLIASDFPDANRADLTDQLAKVMKDGGVNAAQAGAILARNPRSNNMFTRLVPNSWVDGNFGGGLGVNPEGVTAAVNEAKSGQTVDQMLANATVAGAGQSLASTQQTYQKAQQQLDAVVARAASQPGLLSQIPRFRKQLALAQASMQAALDRQQGQPEFQPRRQPN